MGRYHRLFITLLLVFSAIINLYHFLEKLSEERIIDKTTSAGIDIEQEKDKVVLHIKGPVHNILTNV